MTTPLAHELLEEAAKFIEGFAASSESGFARQRKAIDWIRRYQHWSQTERVSELASSTSISVPAK